jgi:hypothetical protein
MVRKLEDALRHSGRTSATAHLREAIALTHARLLALLRSGHEAVGECALSHALFVRGVRALANKCVYPVQNTAAEERLRGLLDTHILKSGYIAAKQLNIARRCWVYSRVKIADIVALFDNTGTFELSEKVGMTSEILDATNKEHLHENPATRSLLYAVSAWHMLNGLFQQHAMRLRICHEVFFEAPGGDMLWICVSADFADIVGVLHHALPSPCLDTPANILRVIVHLIANTEIHELSAYVCSGNTEHICPGSALDKLLTQQSQ